MQLKEMNQDDAVMYASVLQMRIREHQASTTLLVDQYDRRTEWYADSRMIALLTPIASVLATNRLNKRTEARTLRFQLNQPPPPPPWGSVVTIPFPHTPETKVMQAEAQADIGAARQQVWYCEGLCTAIDNLLQACQGPLGYSLDILMRLRQEAKRALQGTAGRAEKALATESEAIKAAHALKCQRDEASGACEALQVLHTHPTLPRGIGYILTCGQAEGVRRKLALFDDKLAKADKERQTAGDASEPEQRKAQSARANVELLSHLIGLQVGRNPSMSPSSPGTPAARPVSPPVEPERPGSGESRGGLTQAAALALLGEMRMGAFEAQEAAQKNVGRLTEVAEEKRKLESQWCAARGASKALGVLRTAFIRFKHWRLERRRQEALGLCIATAQAKVAHRHGKRTLSEVAGSRELLHTLRKQQETLPRPTLELSITLPPASKGKSSNAPGSPGARDAAEDMHLMVATRVVEDCLSWMGWPDEALTYRRHEVRVLEGASVLAVSATVSPVRELASTLGSSDPSTIGGRLLEEALTGRLIPGLANTAALLELGNVNLADAKLTIPSREQLMKHAPPLYQLEAEVSSASTCPCHPPTCPCHPPT